MATLKDDSLLRVIHACAAERGLSTQEYINRLIKPDLFPEQSYQLTEIQLERLREKAATISSALEEIAEIMAVAFGQVPKLGGTMLGGNK